MDAKIINFGDDEHSMLKSVSNIWAMNNNNHNGSNLLGNTSHNNRVNLSPFAYMGAFDNNSNMIPLGVTNGGISQMIGS